LQQEGESCNRSSSSSSVQVNNLFYYYERIIMKHKKINQNLFRCFSRICKNSFCLLYLRDDATRFQIFFFLFCLSSSFFTSISVCFVCVCVFLFGEDLMLSCLTSCFFFLSFAFAMIRINYAVSLQLLQLR
jgi:hypothetical protein